MTTSPQPATSQHPTADQNNNAPWVSPLSVEGSS